jgi:Fe-S-cluster-containing dehydrogenase component/formate-dependent nitrite reductase membrane component NrfD
VNYGFVIDNRKCIGCHACSTACKSENEVPLGVSRTWVKYVERGAYPDVRRTFQVTRCNHCENPPCARICPVTAMYQREDGIVEFDPSACIGCKACMQACPYDAIHVDPDRGTVAKCHYCAHRVDVGLEPACAVVCPTHAIIAGDLDDPTSEIAKLASGHRTTVRKPEQGTRPKVLYIEGDDLAMHPTAIGTPEAMMWADVVGDHRSAPAKRLPVLGQEASARAKARSIRTPAAQGEPAGGPIRGPGTLAEHMVQVAYNAQHKIPWHWPVPAYLVTKGIGTGIFLLLALGFILGLFPMDSAAVTFGGAVSIVATLVTTALLVYDLERPERFLSILLRPQWKSWLTRGAFLLIGFSTVSALWTIGAAFDLLGWASMPEGVSMALAWVTLPLAFGAAVYTAFLFAQAEGRDLWQSPLLPLHLLTQALMMGAAVMLVVGLLLGAPSRLVDISQNTLVATLVVDLMMLLLGEFGIAHASEVAARAAHEISRGRYRTSFWWGVVLVGHVVPLGALLLGASLPVALLTLLTTTVGLFLYEYAFVMAPQEIPNS